MIYLTRRERFNAAHRVYKEEWSEEKNLAVFGKCANPNWHGHNYHLYVTVKGELKKDEAYLVDLKTLSNLINEKIIDELDHKNINLEVKFMKGQVASTENLVIAIWNELEPEVIKLGIMLHSIKLKETENNSIEYFGN